MNALRILFIGGTGTISSACVPRVLAAGHHLTVINRGTTAVRPLPAGVEMLRLDIRDRPPVRCAIGSRDFDVVVNFVAYTADHVESDVELFAGRTGQYVFISSASAYQKPPRQVPVTEATPLDNQFWQYARDKIACEEATPPRGQPSTRRAARPEPRLRRGGHRRTPPAFYGNQFGLTFPLFTHYSVQLWVPEVGGPLDPNNEAHDLVMSVSEA